MLQNLYTTLRTEAYEAVITTGLYLHTQTLLFPLHTGSMLHIYEVSQGKPMRTGRRVKFLIDDVHLLNEGREAAEGFRYAFRAVSEDAAVTGI